MERYIIEKWRPSYNSSILFFKLINFTICFFLEEEIFASTIFQPTRFSIFKRNLHITSISLFLFVVDIWLLFENFFISGREVFSSFFSSRICWYAKYLSLLFMADLNLFEDLCRSITLVINCYLTYYLKGNIFPLQKVIGIVTSLIFL